MYLQFRAHAVNLVAQEFAAKPHDDGALPRSALSVVATTEAMAALKVVTLQRWVHAQLVVDDCQHLFVRVFAVVTFRDAVNY